MRVSACERRLLAALWRVLIPSSQAKSRHLLFARRIATDKQSVKMAATLTFWDRNPPYAAVAVARLGDVPVSPTPDPKATKETVPTLIVSG
jgi:hypothetical protein